MRLPGQAWEQASEESHIIHLKELGKVGDAYVSMRLRL